MKDGFIKVAAVTPKIKVADTTYNGNLIRELMAETAGQGAKVVVFPELCITGYTCGDLFWQEKLLVEAKRQLLLIAAYSKDLDGIFFVGLPFAHKGKLYNVAAAVSGGEVIGIVPKGFLPNYNEFYEERHFTSGEFLDENVWMVGEWLVPVGMNLLFVPELQIGEDLKGDEEHGSSLGSGSAEEERSWKAAVDAELLAMNQLCIGVELCEDLWTPNPPSIRHALYGANLIVNLSASDETTGKSIYRRSLVEGQSARLLCGYIYASAGDGESTQDVVYSGHNIIAENGHVLAESRRFTNDTIYGEIDVQRLCAERRRMGTFDNLAKDKIYRPGQTGRLNLRDGGYVFLDFPMQYSETNLQRYVDPAPFVPSSKSDRDRRCDEILMIQAMGLKKRLEHTNCQHPVVGISGGLDSTLALLVMVRAFDLLGRDHRDLYAVTMPGFGTTDRTYENACQMVRSLGATLMEVPIADAVNIHFRDIGQDAQVHDITYENCQARERTQILMDIANKNNGMVIGTGDMSELALGWATYNGDHMSMYAVNSSVPKTLVRHLVRYYADTCGDDRLSQVLYDVLDTPVSPELLPPEDGRIAQKTEDIVGPYELHDFFLYYVMRFGFTPSKIYRLANIAFEGRYDKEFILKWMKTFYRRFFSQQFKRSCLPDGPKVGTVAVSPRGDLRMPSDACARIWMDELETL